jgi:hypothetical protein
MLEECYPDELRTAFPQPAEDRDGVGRWFANHTGGGEGIVKKLVTFYLLLSEADAAKGAEVTTKSKETVRQPRAASASRRKTVSSPAPSTPQVTLPALETHREKPHRETSDGPSVHINLQVHISSDASTDQIEQVFASMAKHIYKKATE